MRLPLRILLGSILLAGALPSFAAAATIQDLIKLKAAGLSDDILIALIESDGSIFHLKADDVIAIRKEGLSEKVIMAMLATAIKRPAAPAPAAPATRANSPRTEPAVEVTSPTPPSLPVGDQYLPDQSAQITVPPSPAPITINVTQKVEQKVDAPREREVSPYYTSYPYPYYYVSVPVAVRPAAPPPPVYWGFGGQRRPGTWKDK